MDDEFAVELLESGDVSGIDARLAGLGEPDVAAITPRGTQLADPLGVCAALLRGE